MPRCVAAGGHRDDAAISQRAAKHPPTVELGVPSRSGGLGVERVTVLLHIQYENVIVPRTESEELQRTRKSHSRRRVTEKLERRTFPNNSEEGRWGIT
jgi:hypothetical protein